jgi:pyruvate,water dikinase
MIQSEVSGVAFTVDPVTNDKDRIVIEAVWGLGELIVQGSVVPDRYVVQKETFDILSKQISDQYVKLARVGDETKEVKVSNKFLSAQKISDKEIKYLAQQADLLQKHYYFPQDLEWAKDKDGIFIVQTRPITTLPTNLKVKEVKNPVFNDSLAPILKGTPASPGIASGSVKVLKSPKEITKISAGDIMVTKMTSPDYVPAMKKAAAIITDEGGMTSHAAIVSRELGTPCVVGTKEATKVLKDGQIVTVNAQNGSIYLGGVLKIEKKKVKKEKVVSRKTATKLYVNLAEPERAKEVANMDVDGIGLLRAEFMMASIGMHPKEAIKEKKQKKYINLLADGIRIFCKEFYPRNVVYRASDFKTNEYRTLEGGKKWEPEEPNPLLGFRGAFRYIANQEVFTLELKALLKVLSDYNNLSLMIPFVRSPQELKLVRKIVASEGLFNYSSFKFLMMVELPVNVILLEDFIKVGIDGVSIGSNDLTMLITGTDRDNYAVAQAFNERSDAVLWALKRTIQICNKHGITSSICGQAPSIYDDLVEKLVKWGVTGISVNPDAISRVREVIYNSEKMLVKGK